LLHPVVGLTKVYRYPTVMAEVVVLTSVSLIFPVPVVARLLMPVTAALLHENVTPAVAEVTLYANVEPLQAAVGVNVLESVGIGFITTVTFEVLLHPLGVVTV
jgi:hypothetical protein